MQGFRMTNSAPGICAASPLRAGRFAFLDGTKLVLHGLSSGHYPVNVRCEAQATRSQFTAPPGSDTARGTPDG